MSAHHWRETAEATGITVTPLGAKVGAEIRGVDLSQNLPEQTIAVLRAACVENTLLLFRDQDSLTPDAYLAFARRFGGTPDLHTQRHYCLPDHHEIFVVGNVQENGKRIGASRVGLNWHTDHYHLPEPGLFTFLHALVVPPEAGETRYANGIAAYEALPAETRARIDSLKVQHSRARLFRALFPEASEAEMEAERQRVPDVVHPLVRNHPELHRRGLFLGGEWGSHIMGMTQPESEELYAELLAHMIGGEFVYQHSWRPGDVLMSDNRCSLHRASEWDETQHSRRLHRIILIDDTAPN